jgi:hypothetical protein
MVKGQEAEQVGLEVDQADSEKDLLTKTQYKQTQTLKTQ